MLVTWAIIISQACPSGSVNWKTTWYFGPLGVCESAANTSTSSRAAMAAIVFFMRLLTPVPTEGDRRFAHNSAFPAHSSKLSGYGWEREPECQCRAPDRNAARVPARSGRHRHPADLRDVRHSGIDRAARAGFRREPVLAELGSPALRPHPGHSARLARQCVLRISVSRHPASHRAAGEKRSARSMDLWPLEFRGSGPRLGAGSGRV